MNSEWNYAVTLQKEIYIPETNTWTGGRDDVIFCREYDMDEREVALIGTDKSIDLILVGRDNVAGIVDDRDRDDD